MYDNNRGGWRGFWRDRWWRDFWRGGWGRDRGWRDGGRQEMFRATCAECGDSCEVPFKPTWEKPVYCSDCFRDMEWGRNDRDSGRRDFWRDRWDRRDRGWRDFWWREEKKMYPAVCGQCGNDCEVPFKPSSDKPVYCDDCFITDDKSKFKKHEELKIEMDKLNAKLDMIIKHFWIVEVKKEVKKIKLEKALKLEEVKEVVDEVVEEKVEEIKEKKVRKTPAKKATK